MIIIGNKHIFNSFEIKTLRLYSKKVIYIDEDIGHYNILRELKNISSKQKVKCIVLNMKKKASEDLSRYLIELELSGINYYSVSKLLEKRLFKYYIPENKANCDYLYEVKHFSKIQHFQKRFIDFFGVISLSIIAFPICIFSIYKIKQESPGSILFKQIRIGKNAKPFTCYKFRSMHENSHHDPYTRENDTRIFNYGNFMRKTRIDELPQLINVLKGEMHIIGPRAEWDILAHKYEKEIIYYKERYLISPGITGWAQVNYPYGSSSEDSRQKLMYDLYYIKNWNFFLELKTIYKTILIVLGKKGI